MTTIWKFPLRITDSQEIKIPDGAQILSVQVQDGQPCIWALLDETAKTYSRKIGMFGTGHPMPKEFAGKYIGTYQLRNGDVVFHVFEEIA